MRRWVLDSPGHLRRSLDQARRLGWADRFPRRKQLFLGGMGGSAMACDLAACFLEGAIQVQVCRDPHLPAWVGTESAAGLVSYSGNTWETLELSRGCSAAGVPAWAVASGGRLLEEERDRALCFQVPAGFAPRAAAFWLLGPVAQAAGRAAGIDLEESLLEAADRMEEEIRLWEKGRFLPGRDPVALARFLAGRIAVVYTPSEPFRPLGVRWKNQLLENAKQPACEAAFPELAHNEIMGWAAAAGHESLVHLVLEDPGEEEPRMRRLQEASLEELEQEGGRVLRIPGIPGSLPVRMLTHLVLADQVSLEVAALRGIDPLPVDAIERVKEACGKERGA